MRRLIGDGSDPSMARNRKGASTIDDSQRTLNVDTSANDFTSYAGNRGSASGVLGVPSNPSMMRLKRHSVGGSGSTRTMAMMKAGGSMMRLEDSPHRRSLRQYSRDRSPGSGTQGIGSSAR